MIYSNAMTFFIIVTTAATLGRTTSRSRPLPTPRPLSNRLPALRLASLHAGRRGNGTARHSGHGGRLGVRPCRLLRVGRLLSKRPRQAPLFYAVIAVGLILGVAMSLVHLDAIKLLYYSAVFNGIAVVPLIYFVIRLACSKKILGAWVASTAARTWRGWRSR